ncbi:hypothetical protein GPROT2_00055 [Gammaproteobacteria bacterium]|nr:tetratricopeptide repeat protein [Gammaproteobacteria bacterium]QOJ32084.1 MAG: tetratricopeptide repeat protein [Gammaproteobacteria bacterium]CAG0937912.1 hypothetical protein GPROT2_00055 [Gammaproteobacteria bacterium]
MSPHWTEPRLPRWLLALLVAGIGACSGPAQREEPATTAQADPVAASRYAGALAVLAAGDDAQAQPLLQALVLEYPDYSGPMVNLALLHSRRGEPGPATALLERAVTTCTDCAAAWNALGVLQRQQGRFADAEQSYLKALAADAGYANAAFNLGVLYDLYLQRPELAMEQYLRFRQLLADDPAAGDVDKWIADLQRRTRGVQRAVQAEATPP